MKKLSVISIAVFLGYAAQAQDAAPLIDRGLVFNVVNISSILIVIYLISSFILQIIRQNFEFRIKNKIIEKGTDEKIVSQLVKPAEKENKNIALQWFFVLAGIAVGFTIIHFTRPFGIHSLAIMAFSIAAGFAGLYFTTRKKDNASSGTDL